MRLDLNKWGPATVLLAVLAALIVGGGIVNVITTADNAHPYTYAAFLDDIKTFALAIGALAVGNGLLGIGKGVRATAATSPQERNAVADSTPPRGSV